MSNLTLRKIVGIAVSLIVLDMLLPKIPKIIHYPSIRRLNRINKRLR